MRSRVLHVADWDYSCLKRWRSYGTSNLPKRLVAFQDQDGLRSACRFDLSLSDGELQKGLAGRFPHFSPRDC